jgi:hypothetical protein
LNTLLGIPTENESAADLTVTAEAAGEKNDHTTVPDWSRNQGFFAVMGGVSVRLRHANRAGLLQEHEYSFTPSGVELLAMAGALPEISKEDVEERSNADIIAKAIVICQVMWFALQVLSRLIAGLPVTPLETHTTVHVGCAILMYLFWLDKPYNIGRPFNVSDAISVEVGSLLLFRKLWAEEYEQQIHQYEKASEQYWQERVIGLSQNIPQDGLSPSYPVREPIEQAIKRYLLLAHNQSDDEADKEKVWQILARDASAGLQRLTSRYDRTVVLPLLNTTSFPGLQRTVSNLDIRTVWSSWTSNKGHNWSMEKLVNMLFNVTYGAAHLAAWDASSFPSSGEKWAWRASGLMLVAVPVWASLWILWWKASTSNNKWLFIFRNGDMDIIGGPFFCFVIVAYTLARCFFLVEALVSLRALPAKAYQVVQWSTVFPHTS